MRNIKKKIMVQEIQRSYYNRATREEITENLVVPEVLEAPALAPHCVLLEVKVLSEKEVTYSMTPAKFVEHATIEPDAPNPATAE